MTAVLRVYVAGSSKEIERAKKWMAALREADIEVTSTWVEVIEDAGGNNPTDVTREQYIDWVMNDFSEVDDADILWLLLPEAQTTGAWIELGYAFGHGKHIAMSGKHKPIFTPAMYNTYAEEDEKIFEGLKLAKAALQA